MHSIHEIFQWVAREYKGPRPGHHFDPSTYELLREELLAHTAVDNVCIHRTAGREWLEVAGVFYNAKGEVLPPEIGERWIREGRYGQDRSDGDSIRWARLGGELTAPLFEFPYRYFKDRFVEAG